MSIDQSLMTFNYMLWTILQAQTFVIQTNEITTLNHMYLIQFKQTAKCEWTKCIRCNMRSTRRWSCVLQFTWWRAVCCGLHRPMSLVILCLGLNKYIILLCNSLHNVLTRHQQFYVHSTAFVFIAWRKLYSGEKSLILTTSVICFNHM